MMLTYESSRAADKKPLPGAESDQSLIEAQLVAGLRLELYVIMKYLAILALLLIWHRSANSAPNDETTSSTELDSDYLDDVILSPRLLAISHVEEPVRQNAVWAARNLLTHLKLFNLINEVVQANYVKVGDNNGLLFEMGNAVQASKVVKACKDQTAGVCMQLEIEQTKQDFFDGLHDTKM